MKKKWMLFLAAGLVYLLFLHDLEGIIRDRSRASFLTDKSVYSAGFRRQQLPEALYQKLHKTAEENGDWIGLLTASMLDGKFLPEKLSSSGKVYQIYKKNEYEALKNAYRAIWQDIEYFPVASHDVFFEDTWLAERDYGGKRLHEGTDLFGKEDISGYYPVISMTDGIVEKIGWLPLGGYRIGIRSPGGGYFYYAHLSSYEKEFLPGENVNAGDILGYMGNTGYGPAGTRGRFPVHLHLGIYIAVKNNRELSVNPYWVLKNSEKKIRNYTY